jgi:hypothetical protein
LLKQSRDFRPRHRSVRLEHRRQIRERRLLPGVDPAMDKSVVRAPRQRVLARAQVVAQLKTHNGRRRVEPHHEFQTIRFEPAPRSGPAFLTDGFDFVQHDDGD